ncbi:SoxR reducing system RseC family protein [Pasteurellaceae bacterium 22721_9_1]
MITEKAIVIDYQAGIATVQCQSKTACGSCSAKQACGAAALSELNGENTHHIFTLPCITPLKKGQIVEIGLSESAVLFSALLLYVIPLITLLCTTLISAHLFDNELISAIFILFCTALSFFAIRIYAKKVQKKSAFQPILLRVVA